MMTHAEVTDWIDVSVTVRHGMRTGPVTDGRYEMICPPIKIHGSDGAPARAILRPMGPSHAVSGEAAP